MARTMAAIGLAALGFVGCSQQFTVWEVAKDEKGTRGTIVEQGLDRTACELVKQHHVTEIQVAYGPSWATANGAFKVYDDGSEVTVEAVCLPAGKRPA